MFLVSMQNNANYFKMRSTENENSAKIEHWTVKQMASGTKVEI